MRLFVVVLGISRIGCRAVLSASPYFLIFCLPLFFFFLLLCLGLGTVTYYVYYNTLDERTYILMAEMGCGFNAIESLYCVLSNTNRSCIA